MGISLDMPRSPKVRDSIVLPSANLATTPKNKDKGTKRNKIVVKGPKKKKKTTRSFFFNKKGYTKKECTKAIRHFRLSLGVGIYLNLKYTFVVLSFRQNLILVSLLENFGYSCSFGNNLFIYL